MCEPGKHHRLDAQALGQRPGGAVAELTARLLADPDHHPGGHGAQPAEVGLPAGGALQLVQEEVPLVRGGLWAVVRRLGRPRDLLVVLREGDVADPHERCPRRGSCAITADTRSGCAWGEGERGHGAAAEHHGRAGVQVGDQPGDVPGAQLGGGLLSASSNGLRPTPRASVVSTVWLVASRSATGAKASAVIGAATSASSGPARRTSYYSRPPGTPSVAAVIGTGAVVVMGFFRVRAGCVVERETVVGGRTHRCSCPVLDIVGATCPRGPRSDFGNPALPVGGARQRSCPALAGARHRTVRPCA